MSQLGKVPKEEKPAVGKTLNAVKNSVQEAFDAILRNCALLACLIMMASITTVTAFFNNSLSLLTTASEYLHLCDPQTVISWMHALEGPVFGIPLTQLTVLLLEFVQLVVMILIALFLLSDLRMFDRYNRLNDFLNRIRVRLGGEIHG